MGSILGGKWSDRTLARVKRKHGGESFPEVRLTLIAACEAFADRNSISDIKMRLESTFLGMVCLPPSIVVYGWVIQERVHVAAPCVFLFFSGLFSVCVSGFTIQVEASILSCPHQMDILEHVGVHR